MSTIKKITQNTHNDYLNYFTLDAENRAGKKKVYYMASRAEEPGELKLVTGKNTPDGVSIYALYRDPDGTAERVVLIRQYRYTIGDYVYEFPSGVLDPDETYHDTALREMREETGLELEMLDVDPMFELPRFQTIGMTDESCAIVYGYASGAPTNAYEEDSEDIEVVLADRAEVRRILKEEYVSSNCAHHLMHFLHDGSAFAFLSGGN